MSALSDYMNGFTTDNEFLDALYEEQVQNRKEEAKYFERLAEEAALGGDADV